MNSIAAPAHRRTVIRTRRHSSMVTDYHFSVEPASPGGVVAGSLETTASQWIFPGTPERIPLQPRHRVTAGMFNTFFELAVIPEIDVVITFTDAGCRKSPERVSRTLLLVAVIVVVLAAAAVLFFLTGGQTE